MSEFRYVVYSIVLIAGTILAVFAGYRWKSYRNGKDGKQLSETAGKTLGL